ncbi:hypothetical protein ACA910_022096 [Epithemia clementina (nom. ined.)]
MIVIGQFRFLVQVSEQEQQQQPTTASLVADNDNSIQQRLQRPTSTTGEHDALQFITVVGQQALPTRTGAKWSSSTNLQSTSPELTSTTTTMIRLDSSAASVTSSVQTGREQGDEIIQSIPHQPPSTSSTERQNNQNSAIPKQWTMPSSCLTVCNISVDPQTGRYPTRANHQGINMLSHHSYGELADLDFNSWVAAEQVMDRGVDFWNECMPPVVIIYLYTMRDVNRQWKLLHKLIEPPPNNINRPFVVLATGWVVNYKVKWMQQLLKHPNLLRIFASSVEIDRHDSNQVQKVFPIPLGLLRKESMDQGKPLEHVVLHEIQPTTATTNSHSSQHNEGKVNEVSIPNNDGSKITMGKPPMPQTRSSRSNHVATPIIQRHSKLLLVNFSPENFKKAFRNEPFQRCCNSTFKAELNTTCTSGGFYDYNSQLKARLSKSLSSSSLKSPSTGRRLALQSQLYSRYRKGGILGLSRDDYWRKTSLTVYRQWAEHKYTVAPRGQKTDTFRFWESLYLGSVPIVLRRQPYYLDLLERYFHVHSDDEVPILFVDSWKNITKALLEQKWPHFQKIWARPEWQWRNSSPPKYLDVNYVENEIRQAVQFSFQTRPETLPAAVRAYYNPKALDWFWKDRHRCHINQYHTKGA